MYKDQEYLKFVTKTYSKTFSKRQRLPKFIIDVSRASGVSPYSSILDYGSGKDAYGTHILKEYFADVTSYDIGKNFNTVWHNPDALDRVYDIVMMSNVINVQPSKDDIKSVLIEGKNCLTSGGTLYCNFPESPRKSDVTDCELLSIMNEIFDNVTWGMVSNIYTGRNNGR